MNNVFNVKESHYSLCNNDCLVSRKVEIVLYGTEYISVLTPNIWKLIPLE